MRKFTKLLDSSPRLASVHIPKTAGNSVRVALSRNYRNEDISPFIFEGRTPLEDFKHFKFVHGHFGYTVAEKLDSKMITLLRDPADRLLSLYYYLLEKKTRTVAHGKTFEEFLKSDAPNILALADNAQTWQVAYSTKYAERLKLKKSDGAVIAQAIQNLEKFATVGVMEHLRIFVLDIGAKLGLKVGQIGQHNTTKQRPKLGDISDEARDLIVKRTQLDQLLYDHVLHQYVRRKYAQSETAAAA